MRIIWLSRHMPTPRQRAELQRLFPAWEVVIDTNPFRNADDIISRFNALKAREMVVVAPISLIRALTQRCLYPLWAEMEHVRQPDPTDATIEVENSGRHYRFRKFWRIRAVQLDLEDITPITMLVVEEPNV